MALYQSGSGIGALVGVGTTNPTSNLQVYGTPIAAGNVFSVLNTAASGNVAQFSSSTGTALIINANGNVGIGLTNPASNLQVAGNVLTGNVVASVALYGAIAGANTVSATVVSASSNVNAPTMNATTMNAATVIGTTGFYGAVAGQNTVSSSNILVASGLPASIVQGSNVFVFSNAAGLSNVMVMNSIGNVGIGTTSPTSNLQVVGNVLSGNLIASVAVYGAIAGANTVAATVVTASSNVNAPTMNATTMNAATVVGTTGFYGPIVGSNVASVTVLTASTNVNAPTMNTVTMNATTSNITTLNVSSAFMTTANLTTANIVTGNLTTANILSLNVTGDSNIANLTIKSNLYTSNIIMSSNLSTNTGFGNVYLTGNLVVAGNIYSVGGSVGSGSGTSQGILYSLPGNYTLSSAFATGTAGPGIAGYHINMSSFTAEAVASVSAFSATSGMIKFATGGLYQITCVVVGDQPIVKVALGKTTAYTNWTALQAAGTLATTGYDYVYNFPLNSSPSTVITIPVTVTDTTQYYYLDVFFSTAVGTPSVLYPTRSVTAVGTNYGTYVQVGPFGNYLTSATGVASGLLMNCYGTTTLSAPLTSNTFRLAMTSSNGWTVNGVSTSLNVTSGGNFQVNQVGIYEVSLCLNAVGATPMMFGVGSLATDGAPVAQGPYLYQYAPMYTQDPTTVVNLPLNITDTSRYYYIDVIFPGTQTTVALSIVSTFVSLKPVGSYVSPSSNPWNQQGTTITYSNGAVGLGGLNPSLLTETLTVNGNTSFIGNVTVTSDASSNNYVLARRVPAGSLAVSNYVTGSVPLTTTTNLIQNYLSNAAAVVTNAPTVGTALSFPGTVNSYVNLTAQHSAHVNTSSNLFVEAWVYLNSNTGDYTVTYTGNTVSTSGEDWGFKIGGGSGFLTPFLYNTSGGSVFFNAGTAVYNTTWTHVAVSWNSVTKILYAFRNGILQGNSATLTGTPRYFSGNPVSLGSQYLGASSLFNGYIYDMRFIVGSTVPTTTFTAPATPAVFSQTTLPSYTGLSALTGNVIALSLQSQYFPGASTSPYGPCLTLPGTVGSYYSAGVNSAYNTNWGTSGITLEAWVNYASLANANTPGGSILSTIGHMSVGGNEDWAMGARTDGAFGIYYNGNGASCGVITGAGVIVTGQWTHIVFQSNGSRIFLFVNGTQRTDLSVGGYTNTGTSSAASINSPVVIDPNTPIQIGQFSSSAGPNFAIAKARLTFGTSGNPALGNVYSSGNFTASPNFAAVPAGATVAWQLESQYPLPTYPSIQDVTPLPSQITSYGAVPTPIGGVTSNVIGPLTTYPQLDSIRFDGTGYIDYGNAASSALTTNIWANAWTIEGWVYPTTATANIVSRSNTSTGYDWSLGINSTSNVFFDSKATAGEVRGATYLAGSSSDSGNSVAVDASGNVYITGYYLSTGTVPLRNLNGTASAYSLPISSGGTDAFIVKYNAAGSVVAYSYINGTSADAGNSLTVDSSGNLYVTGYYLSTGTVTLRNIDTTASTSSYSLPISSGVTDAFLIKYNSSGSVVAYSYINGSSSDAGNALAVDSSGNLYVTGYYQSTSTVTLRNLDTTASTSSYSLPISTGGSDVFIIKYNSSGSVVAYSYINGNSTSDSGQSLTVDSSGNLYVTGYYQSTSTVTLRNLDTTASTSPYSLPSYAGNSDGFIVKYNSSGSVVAYSYIPGDLSDAGQSLTVDSSGNLYVTGYYQSLVTVTLRNLDTTASTSSYSLPISTGGSDVFIVKYNSSGSVVAYSYINGVTATIGDSGQSLTVDSSGNLYITGYYDSSSTVTLRNLDTTASTSSYSLPIDAGGNDIFIVKYNSSGSVVAYSYINGSSNDGGQSLTVDSGGNLYVTGYYQSASAVTVRNLDTTASASAYTLPISVDRDAFLIKYNTTGLVTTGPSAPVNTWTHVAASYDGSTVWLGAGGRAVPLTPASAPTFITDYSTQIGGTFSRGQITGNLADVRVSNVARYTGSTYTVPSAPFSTDSSTLLLLKSLGGQVGTTLEVQGRGLNSTSIGGTRTVYPYPPAPMSSYLLDTTSNASVTYGQGKYVASSSSELTSSYSWQAFNKLPQTAATPTEWTTNNGYASGVYTGSVTTVDGLGNSYAGEWLQIQMPVSVILSSYSIQPSADSANSQSPVKWWILGSRDGLNWTLVDSRSGITVWTNSGTQSFTVSATQAYNYFRLVANQGISAVVVSIAEWTLNGTEESLCVTSDSKVGVGIANPQRALEVAGDLVVSGTISGGAGLGSFRNRIINGDMRIAQRGTSATVSTSTAYQMIDRWGSYVPAGGGTITIAQRLLTASDTPWQLGFYNSYTVTVVSGATTNLDNIPAYQYIEGYNISDLKWGSSFGQPVTLSFWYRTNLPPGSVLSVPLKNSGATISYISTVTTIGANTWQYATVTIPPPPNGTTWLTTNGIGISMYMFYFNNTGTTFIGAPNTWLSGNYVTAQGSYNWAQTAGNYIELTGLQLEKGTVATPFEFRPYATELALCQRYYYQETMPSVSNYNIVCPMTIITGTTAMGVFKYPVTMRSNAVTLTSSGTYTLDWYTVNANSIGALGVMAGGQGSYNYAQLYATSVGNGTAGSVTVGQVRFLTQNTSGGYIGISAEL
jgi:hypothetical protein